MLDRNVEHLLERAVGGEKLTREEVRPLFAFSTQSLEAAAVRWAAQTIGRRASRNTGQIYAQIGVDQLPCHVNCQFCQYAAKHYSGPGKDAVMPLEDVLAYSRAFDEAGVHVIVYMATGGFRFDAMVELLHEVRKVVRPALPLLVNMDDMTLQQAQQLKAAGAQGAYHAIRVGEGVMTEADPAVRMRSAHNILDAGLQLMNAVEPLLADTPVDDILDKMEETLSLRPYCSGVNTLTPVPGTPMEYAEPLGKPKSTYYAAIMRLLAGRDVPFGIGAGNVQWVDAGSSARGRSLSTNLEVLQNNVRHQRKALQREGWDVPANPWHAWFK